MRKRNFIIFIFAGFFLMLVIMASLYYGIQNVLTETKQDTGIIVPGSKPVYHFAMICESVEDPFWLSIKKGVERASKEFNVAVEFNGPKFTNADEQRKYLDIAIVSKVDGIATHVWDVQQAGSLIDRGVGMGIPAVTIGTDANNSKRTAFIGANTYDVGVQLGKMLISATGGNAKAVVILNRNRAGETTVQNLMLLGIQDAIQHYPGIGMQTIETVNTGFLGIEDALKSILNDRPEVDTILCTTEGDIEGVAQRLVDLNKVGYHLIGYGVSPEVLRYIDREVIYGVVTVDPEQMGYDAIRALVDIKKQGRTSAYFPVDIRKITKMNVSDYLEPGEK